jgi:23S rRNA pseudouridine1911/1915/1917 synthase
MFDADIGHPDLRILFEDNHLIVVHKPGGLLAQGDRTGDESVVDLVKQYIKIKYQKPGAVFLGLCHRLDRPVSGALLLARTSKALTRVNKMFSAGTISKTYIALTDQQIPPQGTVRQWLIKDRKRNKVTAFAGEKSNAKEAVTEYVLIASRGDHNLVLLSPKTGRPHQLRVAMAGLGAPILGDTKYGSKVRVKDYIFLHSLRLRFEHPVKREMTSILADFPNQTYWQRFADLKEELLIAAS